MTTVNIPAITGGIVERFDGDTPITYAVKSGQTVAGGNLVELTGDLEVQAAQAGSVKCVGVALFDGDGSGDIKHISVDCEGTYDLVASGAISAGDKVKCAATGAVSAWQTVTDSVDEIVGIALAAIADTAKGPIQLRLGS